MSRRSKELTERKRFVIGRRVRRRDGILSGMERLEARQVMAGDVSLAGHPALLAPVLPSPPSASGFTIQWEGRQLHAVPNEFVFQFGTTTAPSLPANWSVRSLGAGSWLLSAPGGSESQIKSWAHDVGAAKLEPNYIMRPLGTPVDPQYSRQWHLPKINAPTAWDTTTGSGSIVVAVLDSGVDYNNPDFSKAGTLDRKNIWTNARELGGRAGVDDDGNGYVDDVYGYDFGAGDSNPMDDDPLWEDREDANIDELGTKASINKYTGHGTAVAGVMGAVAGSTNPQQAVAGVNWDLNIMALKITRPGFGYVLDAAVQAYKYIQTMQADPFNVNIVTANCSWGTYDSNVAVLNLESEITKAGGQNVLTVAAAGDSGRNIDVTPFYPAAFQSDYVLSVAATDQADRLWAGSGDYAWRDNRSNYGLRNVDVAAPGKQILTTIATAIGGGTGNWEGSSMATGIVSGVAALMRAAFLSSPPLTIKNVIVNTARKVQALSGTSVSGGVVDAGKAVQAIMLPEFPVIDIRKLPGQEDGVVEGNTGFRSATWQIRARGSLNLVNNVAETRTLYVDYRTVDSSQGGGTASPDGRMDPRTTKAEDMKSDYVPVQGTLAFQAGPRIVDYRLSKFNAQIDVGRIKSIPVKIFGDRNVEASETMTLRIENVYYLSADGMTKEYHNEWIATRSDIFTIINDDVAAVTNTDPDARTPQITFLGNTPSTGNGGSSSSTVSAREGDTGMSMMRFPLRLSLPTTNRVTVRYRTIDVDGRAGVDYGAKTGMVTFAPGVTTATIRIPLINNTVQNGGRTFQLLLSGPTNAGLSVSAILCSIDDDD